MIQETIGITGTDLQKPVRAAEKIEGGRKEREKEKRADSVAAQRQDKIPAEELLNKIKELTEDGLYSVRFDNDEESQALVVKVVDRKTDEVIRQVPSEELLGLRQRLDEFQGNIIDTIT
ncbi:MAG: flagellar protein FlaG [Desulfobulbaceae bacterium]|jgi:flagellar protein FlaG|nr:flagellar protein FlaG [Desulfobulbaceae bacterium]